MALKPIILFPPSYPVVTHDRLTILDAATWATAPTGTHTRRWRVKWDNAELNPVSREESGGTEAPISPIVTPQTSDPAQRGCCLPLSPIPTEDLSLRSLYLCEQIKEFKMSTRLTLKVPPYTMYTWIMCLFWTFIG